MATRKPCKTLNLEAMTNREVLGELTRIYGDLLDRISAYADVLDASHEHEDVSTTPPDDDFDDVYDQAVGLISRIEEAIVAFESGNSALRTRDGDRWNWGLRRFKANLKERAVAGLAALS